MTQNTLFGTFECECGFKGNVLQIEKHFKKSWTYMNNQVEKNGHTVKTEEVKPFRHSEECEEYNFNYESGSGGLCICEAGEGN